MDIQKYYEIYKNIIRQTVFKINRFLKKLKTGHQLLGNLSSKILKSLFWQF